MKELDELIDKTASALKNIFIKYFSTKSEVELLKIRKILEVYPKIITVILNERISLKDFISQNKKLQFIEHCNRYAKYHSIVVKKISKEFIKNYIENEH